MKNVNSTHIELREVYKIYLFFNRIIGDHMMIIMS